jgi:hypothetical protein
VTMKTLSALNLYEVGQLFSHAAAVLAGISRREFLQRLRTHQIPPFERVDATGTATPLVNELSDADLLRIATTQMPAWQSRRLHELLDQQREGQLATEEQVELTHLLRLNDRALLLKSEALVDAVHRSLCEAGAGASWTTRMDDN